MRDLCIMDFFSAARPDTKLSPSAQIARNFLRTLLQDDNAQPFDSRALRTLLHALFVERNPELLYEFRQGLQEVLNEFPSIANAENLKPAAANAILTYILCLLPHAEIKPGQIYSIPVYLNGCWQTSPYRVRDIRLTPIWGLEAYTMTDSEHVFAYGFEPVEMPTRESFPPLLVFKGTPTFTGQGFSNYVWHALNPFSMSPRNRLKRDHSGLNAWFSEHVTIKQARVYAFGEGAAMLAELLTNNPEFDTNAKSNPDKSLKKKYSNLHKISTINAYNPSVSTQHYLEQLATSEENTDEWSSVKPKLIVNMFNNEGDAFAKTSGSSLDKPFVSKHLISAPPKNAQQRFLMNHVLCFAGKGELTTPEPHVDAKQWWFMAAANQALSHLAFGLLVLPCQLLVLPTVRALLKHKTEALILASMIFVFSIFPLYTTPLGTVITIGVSLYLAYKMLPALKRLVGLAPEPEPECHKLSEPRDLAATVLHDKAETISHPEAAIRVSPSI